MSWLDRFARPKVRGLFRKDNIPHDLWEKCPKCEQMIFHRELENNQRVCPHCDHHLRLDARTRLTNLFDDGEFQTIELPEVAADPLRFRDRKRYTDRLKDARSAANQDAVIVAHGALGGHSVVAAVFDFSFLGGSMGVAAGEALLAGARLAVLQDSSFIVVPASGGARMQEGTLSLMQMARTTIAVDELKEAHLPYIVVFTHPTTGGVTASFAMLGDIAIAEPGAVIGFAGARVIEDTIREKLPEGFQRSENLLEHGMIDMVVRRHDLRDTIARTISLLRNTGAPALTPVVELSHDAQPVG